MPILYCGATPVFADIDEDAFNIAPDAIEEALKKDPVHQDAADRAFIRAPLRYKCIMQPGRSVSVRKRWSKTAQTWRRMEWAESWHFWESRLFQLLPR